MIALSHYWALLAIFTCVGQGKEGKAETVLNQFGITSFSVKSLEPRESTGIIVYALIH